MPYSPPVAKPCTSLQTIRTTAASAPRVARVGMIAITKEHAAISVMLSVSAARRPCRSA